jgi:hypothetical protein
MAGPFGRATWFFTDPGFSGGWSETLYNTVSGIPSLTTLATTYAKNRFPLLSYNQSISHIRLTTYNTPPTPNGGTIILYGGVQYTQTQLDANPQLQVLVSNAADLPQASIQCSFLETNGVRKKTLYFRGVPDRIEVNPPGPTVMTDAAYLKLWNRWTNGVISDGWGWLGRTPVPAPTIMVQSVLVTAGGGGLPSIMLVTTTAAHGLTVPGKISFKGGRSTPRLKGTYQLLTAAGNSFTVAVNTTTTPVITSPPFVIPFTYTLYTVGPNGSITIAGETTHRVGRPFGQPRGRRKHAALTV